MKIAILNATLLFYRQLKLSTEVNSSMFNLNSITKISINITKTEK